GDVGGTQYVVVEAVPLVPQALRGGRGRDVGEVLEELGREVGVPPVVVGQHHRDLQQVQRVAGHPRGTVALFQHPGYRQVAGPVERPDVVQPEEAALEDVVAA